MNQILEAIFTYATEHRAALIRGLIVGFGYLLHNGHVPQPIADLFYALSNDPAFASVTLAALIPAGDKNRPPGLRP